MLCADLSHQCVTAIKNPTENSISVVAMSIVITMKHANKVRPID